MPQKNEASGRRSVEMEIELPGTPERVWQAIATGSRLFCLVPADGFIEGREDGAVRVSKGIERIE